MNLFELFVKIDVDDKASSKLGNITSKLGSGLKTAGKIGTAAVSAASGAIVALTKQAVENYAEYEQLVGGVETLFKNSAGIVMGYAENAYKTAGLSANEYMSTVTSFSASLLQSLGGDTEAAAKYADMAVRDMSDNANKMGTSMEMIQSAYQGFAKQNYTMLDNLKLGYGGTKTEMQRLIADAAKLDSSIDANSLSFGNIVAAINVVQKEMGIYGTTALEAEKTISGSLASTKAAWSNLVTGVADDNADFEQLINNFVESVGTTATNILPRIQTALEGGGKLVEELIPVIIEQIPQLVNDTLPKMLESGVNIITTILEGISKDPDAIVKTIFNVITVLIKAIINLLPKIIETGVKLLVALIKGIVSYFGPLAETAKKTFEKFKDTIKNKLSDMIEQGRNAVNEFISGIKNKFSDLVQTGAEVFQNVRDAVRNRISEIITEGKELITNFISGVKSLFSSVASAGSEIISTAKEAISERVYEFFSIGSSIVEGVWSGIQNAIGWFTSRVSSFFSGIVDDVKSTLGINSPSKVFAKIGKFMAEGLGVGWDDEIDKVQKDIEDSLDFSGGYTNSFNLIGNGVNGKPINITQNIYAQKKSAAQLMQEARWQAQMGVLAVV